MNRAIFMDRDGVINRLPPKFPNDGLGDIRNYVTEWEDFHYLPGAYDAVEMAHKAGFKTIVVSNQGGAIGRKIPGSEKIPGIFNLMWGDFEGRLDAYYFCPHLIADNCACIKPKPGMLYKAAIEHDIVLEDSWMVGDSRTDIEVGRNANLKGCIGIGDNLDIFRGRPAWPAWNVNTLKLSLLEAVKFILDAEGVNSQVWRTDFCSC